MNERPDCAKELQRNRKKSKLPLPSISRFGHFLSTWRGKKMENGLRDFPRLILDLGLPTIWRLWTLGDDEIIRS